MELSNTIIIFSILAISSVLYKGYENKAKLNEMATQTDLLKKYFYNDDSTIKNDKPIIWIHLTHDVNSRWWQNFYSRNTTLLNQPYLYLTISSIINSCADNFNIYIIDDSSFTKLLPDLNIDILSTDDILRSHFRKLFISKILYKYGGVLVPSSFLCLNNLYTLYDEGIRKKGMFVCESVNRSNPYSNSNFTVSNKFMGCVKNNSMMLEYIKMLEYLISTDYTQSMDFRDSINNWCSTKILNNKINIISGKKIGIKTTHNKPILIEHLLGNGQIDMPDFTYGILIPADDILLRNKYMWFSRMSIGQILKSQLTISNYIITPLNI